MKWQLLPSRRFRSAYPARKIRKPKSTLGLVVLGQKGFQKWVAVSVASFFVSRVDTAVDPLLPADSKLRGSAAISNAAMAYEAFQSFEASATWKNLKSAGCNSQRPLWASTGVKDPSYDPNRYVIDLIAPNTVNTMPEQTLESVKKTGVFKGPTINNNLALAKSNTAGRISLSALKINSQIVF